MQVISVKKDNRAYYLTTGLDPKGRGLLAVISKGHVQRGEETTVLDVEIVKNVKEARRWYKRQMKTKPWLVPALASIELPKELGRVTELEALGGKLVARTESGTPFIVPLPKIDG